MAIDHLVFNNQNWFNVADNADNVTANGKKYYAFPSKITIKQGVSIIYPAPGVDNSFFPHPLEQDAEVKCIAANDKYYFFVGYAWDNGYYFSEDKTVGLVLKSNCKNIVWG